MSSARRLYVLGAAVLGIALMPAAAQAATVSATTNKGGACTIQTHAARGLLTINYGVDVNTCSAHFGIRSVSSQGMGYDSTTQTQDQGLVMRRKCVTVSAPPDCTVGTPIPYSNANTPPNSFIGTPGDDYYTRVDVSVVLISGTFKKKWKKRCKRPFQDADDFGRGANGDGDHDDRKVCKQLYKRYLEQWQGPPANCRIKTTFRAKDTLGCILRDSLPA
jgi:hypothetical protein